MASYRSHTHSHEHVHSTGNLRTAFFINTIFSLIELVGGLYTNSVAILSDALHDFGDSISLGVSWYLQKKSNKPKDNTFTYGYKRFSLLGAFINSFILIIGSVFVIKEAISRLANPIQANARGMLILAFLGIAFNGLAMLRLKKGSSLNERVVSLHFLEDILGWIAILLGSAVMMFVDIPILDPILSLGIAGFILFNVYRNLKPALTIILQGIPGNARQEEIIALVKKFRQVQNIHDFRMWSLDGEHHVLSMHAVVSANLSLKDAEHLKEQIKSELQKLNITHATIEIEYKPEHD